MGEAGLFRHERVELLDGESVTMSPHNSPHAGITGRLAAPLIRLVGDRSSVRVQFPIILNDWSEPGPDIGVCQLDPDDPVRKYPRADQVLLVIEVADSGLLYDRNRKARASASSKISGYWIINLVDQRIEILNDPAPTDQRFQNEVRIKAGDSLALLGQVIAAALLPHS